MGKITIDTDVLRRLKESPDEVKQSGLAEDDVRSDPRSALARFGVEIDDEMNESLKQKLSAKGAAQAGSIHIDL